jgi:hypothetical protein
MNWKALQTALVPPSGFCKFAAAFMLLAAVSHGKEWSTPGAVLITGGLLYLWYLLVLAMAVITFYFRSRKNRIKHVGV